MAVSDVEPYGTQTGDGSTTSFAYAYQILAESEIVVRVDDVLQTLAVDYTLTGVGNANGGNIVFVTAPAADAVIAHERNSALERATNYVSELRAAVVNLDFDRLWLKMQEIAVGIGVSSNLTPAQWAALAASLPTDGSAFSVVEVTDYVTMTATGIAFTGDCELAGFDCTAVTGTPTITIYDGVDNTGTVIVPATTLTVGRTEFNWKRALVDGCYVVLSGTQTVNVLVSAP